MTDTRKASREGAYPDVSGEVDVLLAAVAGLNFMEIETLSTELPPMLDALSQRAKLTELVRRFAMSTNLRSMSERLAELDKLVLYFDAETDVRIRMHIFRQGYWDRPHNHRFNFGTKLLRGSYQHTIYGHTSDSNHLPHDLLKSRLRRIESEGHGYVIEHTLVHSVAATGRTMTLTARGPAVKDAMLIVGDNGPFCAFGAKSESEEEIAAKRLSQSHIAELVELLRSSNLIGPFNSP